MSQIYRYRPVDTEHPGVILEEKLQEIGMSVKEFAFRADRPEQSVLEIIRGTCSITPDMAITIEYVTGMSAEVLLNWQRKYDEYKARRTAMDRLGKDRTWLSSFPMEEMMDKGWVERRDNADEQVDALLRYFGVASPSAWENCYFKQRLKVAFRISLERTAEPYSVSAWLRQGEIQAMNNLLDKPFDGKSLKGKMHEIALLIQSPPDDILPILEKMLADSGVKLIFTEPLAGIPIKGAARWIYGWPCIQLLSERQLYEDFRFTILHELGHILLHGKKDIFLEQAGFRPDDDPVYEKKEREADAFARKWLAENV